MPDDIRHNAARRQFEADTPGGLAVATYRMDGQTMILSHTVVPPAAQGGGIATRLVRAALAFARTQNYKIIPQCSFVAAYIQRHPENKDLLASP
jgi:uncharacterized protein